MPLVATDLPELLHRVFGHREFRAHQQPVCEAAASGRDVLLVMPTGAGKSLCYQLPALARGGTALVISPLIALMDDQAAKLDALHLRVARIHSGLSRDDSRQACRDYLDGNLDFLFIAPERLRVPGFPEMLARRKPALVAIDEAHCISQWGHDFRPDYRTLGQYLPALRPAPIIALTATATPTVQKDILRALNLQDPAVFITGFRRNNLQIEVSELSKPQRCQFITKLLSQPAARPAIVYAASRKSAEELAGALGGKYSAAAYHAGLDGGTRERVQRNFLSGKLDVVVATIAFGMGVDKADVRTVVHSALPGSVEAYYQEIGRAGRDGLTSRAILLHSFADRKMHDFFLERDYPPVSDLGRISSALKAAPLTIDDLQRQLQMERETVERSVEKLLAQGAAAVEPDGTLRSQGELRWQDDYAAQVNHRREQIDRMVAFTEGSGCRMAALVRHFGDASDGGRPCGLCDSCDPQRSTSSSVHQPSPSEKQDLLAILHALKSGGRSTGKLFTELNLTKDRKNFDLLLGGLHQAGLIHIASESFRTEDGRDIGYRKASLTLDGRTADDVALATVCLRDAIEKEGASKKSGRLRSSAASDRRLPPPILSSRNTSLRSAPGPELAVKAHLPATQVAVLKSRTSHTPKSSVQTLPREVIDPELDARLREWRREQATQSGLPTFFILSETALRKVVAAKPKTLEELGSVAEIGADKLARYGPAVVALCHQS